MEKIFFLFLLITLPGANTCRASLVESTREPLEFGEIVESARTMEVLRSLAPRRSCYMHLALSPAANPLNFLPEIFLGTSTYTNNPVQTEEADLDDFHVLQGNEYHALGFQFRNNQWFTCAGDASFGQARNCQAIGSDFRPVLYFRNYDNMAGGFFRVHDGELEICEASEIMATRHTLQTRNTNLFNFIARQNHTDPEIAQFFRPHCNRRRMRITVTPQTNTQVRQLHIRQFEGNSQPYIGRNSPPADQLQSEVLIENYSRGPRNTWSVRERGTQVMAPGHTTFDCNGRHYVPLRQNRVTEPEQVPPAQPAQ